jgi:hypothetical protein
MVLHRRQSSFNGAARLRSTMATICVVRLYADMQKHLRIPVSFGQIARSSAKGTPTDGQRFQESNDIHKIDAEAAPSIMTTKRWTGSDAKILFRLPHLLAGWGDG